MAKEDQVTVSDVPLVSLDTWQNLLSGVGNNAIDRRLSTTFQRADTVSRQVSEDLFHDDDISNRIAKLPALDRWREWLDFTAETSEQIDYIVGEHERLNTIKHFGDAQIWANVTGGALVYMRVVDGRNPEEPVDMDRVRALDGLSVFDRQDLHIRTVDMDPLSPTFNEPEIYEIRPFGGLRAPVGPPRLVHSSRVVRFDGAITSRRRQARNLGWSDSRFQRLFQRLRGYNGAWDSVEILLEDFSQAVYKIQNLREMVTDTNGAANLAARMQAVELCRGSLRAMLLDAENEEFERTPTPMSGLPEVIELIMLRMAAAAEMPVTLLFGRSPAGLNATGDNDLRQYYDRIKAEQTNEGKPQIVKLTNMLWAAAPPSVGRPEKWNCKFKPLRQPSDTETAQIHHSQAQADQLYVQMGYPVEKILESRFRGTGFSMSTLPLTKEELDAVVAKTELENQSEPTDPSDGQQGDDLQADAGADENVQNTVLNGIQTNAMTEIVQSVARRELPRASGVHILQTAFFLPASTAEQIMGEAGVTFFIEAPTPVPADNPMQNADQPVDNPETE